jgi:hypothetical protein
MLTNFIAVFSEVLFLKGFGSGEPSPGLGNSVPLSPEKGLRLFANPYNLFCKSPNITV